MTLDREELLSVLADASAALGRPAVTSGKSTAIPGLDHFWFDGDYVYAYDGGLGIRAELKMDLECGVPGKPLLDLLKTSALKQLSVSTVKNDVVLQLGKSKVNLVSTEFDRCAWPTEWDISEKKKPKDLICTLKLSEALLEAMTRLSFVRAMGKVEIPQVVHRGLTIIPQKSSIEVYATDSVSLARVVVKEKPPSDLPKFLLPWEFVDQLLKLVEPNASLYVMESYYMVEGDGVLLCSNKMDLPEEPDLAHTIGFHLRDDQDVAAEIPAGLQSVLDRAVILSGNDMPLVKFTTEGKTLILEGQYGLGSLDEELPLKAKLEEASAKFRAPIVRRILGQAKVFMLSSKALTFDDDDSFVCIVASHYEVAKASKRKLVKAEDDEPVGKVKDRPARRRSRQQETEDDEIPF